MNFLPLSGGGGWSKWSFFFLATSDGADGIYLNGICAVYISEAGSSERNLLSKPSILFLGQVVLSSLRYKDSVPKRRKSH